MLMLSVVCISRSSNHHHGFTSQDYLQALVVALTLKAMVLLHRLLQGTNSKLHTVLWSINS